MTFRQNSVLEVISLMVEGLWVSFLLAGREDGVSEVQIQVPFDENQNLNQESLLTINTIQENLSKIFC